MHCASLGRPVAACSRAGAQHTRHWRCCRQHRAARLVAATAAAPARAVHLCEDKWIERTLEVIVPESAALPKPLASLQASCLSALATLRMPTTRNEEYRFTDLRSLLQHSLGPTAGAAPDAAVRAACSLKQVAAATVVVADGVIDQQQSSIRDLPAGVYVGGLVGAPQDIVSLALGAQSRSRGGPFATLNGAAAQDVVVVHVPASTVMPGPIHVLYLASSAAAASGGRAPVAMPRLLAVLEKGAVADIVEEFAGPAAAAPLAPADAKTADSSLNYFTDAVAEFELDDSAVLKHSYVQLESTGVAHMKATLVNQGRKSSYSLTEARVGGTLSRHDLNIEQLGEGTHSEMRSFLLCGDGQLHDLHSKLTLDHPNGEANQLHKCIVSSPTGRGVFDGNVRVNRLAQKTDAQQLSRNLLLVPRATIIADDVKCTHGCTVSDLEEEELFYLRARGVTANVARQMLVYSFGLEVVQGLRDDALQARVEAAVQRTLDSFATRL
ncbi:hypothetical protein CHLNCDRAFT_59225 [Chlorella variabilis]|uniref:Uncharacterized protein n=1 Tax=Chlorella variabilis TaxID=554065 RepID=E1ZRS6_CHLVA|nr:hypothetical protein CHLNCDRAFT_59225 [Chlorella variabilis]EFN51512.1 hypothetical protein CHLNCDRAFT_59225 [Chlorella variabilis]|eukprot:XP_005843614.1 hypothetical protein CHLNCDRAFT_59225 [Chlorella variabilis]